MKAIFSALFAYSTLMVTAVDTWGGSYSFGPSKTNIIEMTTTLTPGSAPSTQNGVLFLWPGISNGTGDLVQTVVESWTDNSWCGAGKNEWCVRASTFGSFGWRYGQDGVVKATDSVTINYKLGSNNMTWYQTVTIDGKVVSTFESDSGPYMKGWGTGTECNDGCTGTIAEQTYTNTVITLDAADPTFGSTAASAQGATATGLTSEHDGKVWKIASINIPKMG